MKRRKERLKHLGSEQRAFCRATMEEMLPLGETYWVGEAAVQRAHGVLRWRNRGTSACMATNQLQLIELSKRKGNHRTLRLPE